MTQVWWDGARQARLARLLSLIDVRAVGLAEARAAGELLAATGTSDAVDALVTSIAMPGDQLPTSDPGDLERIATVLACQVSIVRV